MTKNKTSLKLFGKCIIDVRDKSVTELHSVFTGVAKAPSLQIFVDYMKNISEREKSIVSKFLLDTIDTVLHNMLFMFHEHENEFQLVTKDEDGKDIILTQISDGLQGDLFRWIEEYSKYQED